jgi:site-specific DNA recombinase
MKKVLIYCRVSSERQKKEGHGLDSQEHRCREYAIQKGYGEPEKVFRDSFSGGGDFMKRPAMSELISHIDKNIHQQYVVIFDDLTRLARDVVFHIKLRAAFDSRGVKVECLNFSFDDSPEGEFYEIMMAARGQYDRKHNRRQVVQKMKARLELGYWVFPDVPPGYEYKKDPTQGMISVKVPEFSDIIKEGLEGFASGRFLEQIDLQKFFQDRDVRKGKPIYLEWVKRVLTRSFYAGFIEYEPWEVSRRVGKHEPLITPDVFQRIQDKLAGKTTTHTKKLLNEDFPLRGFVICGTCRQPLTASWSKGRNGKFPYYRCKTKSCSEKNKSIRRDVIESEFSNILGKIKPSSQVLDLTKAIVADLWKKKQKEILESRKKIEREVAECDLERSKLVKLASRAVDEGVVATYEERIGILVEKMTVLKKSLTSFDLHEPSIETALDIVFDFLKHPLKRWENDNIHTKRLVLRLVFEQKLAYNKNSGFETAILSLPLRVFTLCEPLKPSLVEMRGIEPRCT